jgi:SAM-dependent methyltransferase
VHEPGAARKSAFERLHGAVYDVGAQWEPTARLGARIEWGADLSPMYASMAALGQVQDGAAVLDVPCGGGLAFKALRPTQRVRYVAVDASALMLRRAARRARRLGLGQIELLRADVARLPLPSGCVDLCVSFNGIQCFSEPARGIAEMARCIRPGGAIVGTTVVGGARARSDRAIELYRRLNAFGPGGTTEELLAWLRTAGFLDIELRQNGALACFRARKDATGA